MIDFSIADKIYLGDTEVSKLYKGSELLYEKQAIPTGDGVYIENGDLVFPEGLVVNLSDFTAGEPTTTIYSLPKTISISGADNYNEQLDDGTEFSFYADMEGINNEYAKGMTRYTYSRYSNSEFTTSTSSSIQNTIIKTDTHYVKGQSEGYPVNSRYKILKFMLDNSCTNMNLTLNISNFVGSSASPVIGQLLGVNEIYIHDFGITDPSYNQLSYFDTSYPPIIGKISNDDIALDFTFNTVLNITKSNLDFIAGHYYVIYALSSKVFKGSYPCESSSGELTISKSTPYNHHNEDMYISGMGYTSSSDKKFVQISVTDREPQTEFGEQNFGMVKYNPTQGWYGLIPVNN